MSTAAAAGVAVAAAAGVAVVAAVVTSPAPIPADGSSETQHIIGAVALLALLGFGIRWMYQRLMGGGYNSSKKGDWELDGDMRTRIDHGDL
mmetsp:Transcript_374/g.1659  ORF Transcript_374/g.1659 Transcript_374/m.1659 type:complete len:91 (+) Transcript_374:2-274(+)